MNSEIKTHLTVDRTTEEFERWIYTFGGRFICILVNNSVQTVYLDASGSLALVYRPDWKEAASTPTLLNWLHDHPVIDQNLAFHTHKPNGYYRAGVTYDPFISRLQPNHVLDLATFTALRHWPKPDFAYFSEGETVEAVHQIVDCIKKTITAVHTKLPVYLSITGGKDTRILLAASRQHLKTMQFVSLGTYSPTGSDDLEWSRAFCKENGMDHTVVPTGEVGEFNRLCYQVRTGYCGASGRARSFDQGLRHVNLNSAYFTAFDGAPAKAHWIKKHGPARHLINPKSMMRLIGIADNPDYQEVFDHWYAQLPDLPPALLLDLLFIEMRAAGWSGPHMYGMAPFTANLGPFVHRQVFGQQMQLPVEYRIKDRFFHDVADYLWPELNDYPYVARNRKQPLHYRLKQAVFKLLFGYR